MKQGFCILVVDKDIRYRQRIVKQLRNTYANVIEAQSPDEAWNLYQTCSPSIIFAEVTTAEENGRISTKLVSADDPGVLMAVLTGSTESWQIKEWVQAGVSEILSPPTSPQDLKRIVNKLAVLAQRRRCKTFQPETLAKAHLEFELHSKGAAITPTVDLILNVLRGFVEEKRLARFELAIEESLRNAYEHGNLGIKGDEKYDFCETETLENVLREREEEAVEQGKMIRVSVDCSVDEFSCTIEDQGSGFNWRDVQSPTDNIEALTSLHGRGLLLIRNVFDSVAFNEKGNKVTMVKKLR